MEKPIPLCILCVIISVCLLSGPIQSAMVSPHSTAASTGWLEVRDGVTILHVSGTNYDMGYQHGSLLREQVQQDVRAVIHSVNITLPELIVIWHVMETYVPQEYLDEMQGMADGANISVDELAAANIAMIATLMGCFGISAWGNATVDGRLYHMRSFDQPMNIQDPVTGRYAHENAILVVRNPDNGYGSVAPSIAGSMHGGGGVNTQGIAVGMQVCWSHDYTLHGMPAQFRVQQVLDHASTAQEAITYLTSNLELGWNFILSDSKIPAGYAVETTANHTYVGTDNTTVESTKPFWAINDVVRRTNFFIDPTTAETQRAYYNPSGLASLLRLVKRADIFFAVWRSYKAGSDTIEDHYGAMDVNTTMRMMRDCYSGKTDLLLHLIIVLAKGTSFNHSWNLWVACPQTGELAVCFASKDKIAYQNPVHHFNFYDLLNETPRQG